MVEEAKERGGELSLTGNSHSVTGKRKKWNAAAHSLGGSSRTCKEYLTVHLVATRREDKQAQENKGARWLEISHVKQTPVNAYDGKNGQAVRTYEKI